MDDRELVVKLVSLLGEKQNIKSVTNCMTRLRVEVRDASAVREDALKATDGVMALISGGVNRYEIVLGPGKCRKCADLCREMGLIAEDDASMSAGGDWRENKAALRKGQKRSGVKDVLKSFGEVFVPLIPGVITAGLCAGLAMLIAQSVPNYRDGGVWGILYQLLTLLNTSFMTYITAWAGYRAAEKFGATPILGGMLGMMTGLDGINALSPMLGMWNEAAPLNSVLRAGRGGVLAVILGVWCLSVVEKQIRKRMPESMDVAFTPLLSLLACSVPYVLIIMPAMGFVSTGISAAVQWACMSESTLLRIAAGYITTALFLPLVAMGMHHGLVAIYSVQLATQGFVTLYPSLAMAGAGQVGAALAIYMKAKRVKNERLCRVISGALPAGLLGIGEPLIYGVTLPMGRPFITAGLGAGFGGAFVMAMQVAATTWGPSGLLGFFVMTAGPNSPVQTMVYYGIGLAVSIVMGAVITWFGIGEKDVAAEEKPQVPVKKMEGRRVSHGEIVISTETDGAFRYTIRDALGIHARPAGALVKLAGQYDARIRISAGERTANAASIMELMALGAKQGTVLKIEAEGAQAEQAMHAVREFLTKNL